MRLPFHALLRDRRALPLAAIARLFVGGSGFARQATSLLDTAQPKPGWTFDNA
jgi:hypothetical protein